MGMETIERLLEQCERLDDDRLTEELRLAAEKERESLVGLLARRTPG